MDRGITEEEARKALQAIIERNREILSFLRSKGVETDKPCPTLHFFLTPSQLEAAKLVAELEPRGFLIKDIAPVETEDGTSMWSVEAEMDMALDLAASEETARELLGIGLKYGCRYDGWTAEID